jgi:hypothetical protein
MESMKRAMLALSAITMCAGVAYGHLGDLEMLHLGCDPYQVLQDHAMPIESSITPNLGVLVWTGGETNDTGSPYEWIITEKVITTHAWSIGLAVTANLRAGLLARVVADARIGVTVEGEYSGSKQKERDITVKPVVPACRTYKRREYVDMYSCTDSQVFYDWAVACQDSGTHPELDPGQYLISYYPEHKHTCTGSGSGDDNKHGMTSDMGPWTQSTRPDCPCYAAP